MRNFRDLIIWKGAINIANEIYEITSEFPEREKYGIISQMRRCAVSISSNVVEGCSKSTSKHLAQYLETSLGSAFELETQLILCKELGFLSHEVFDTILPNLNRLQKSMNSFRSAIYRQGVS